MLQTEQGLVRAQQESEEDRERLRTEIQTAKRDMQSMSFARRAEAEKFKKLQEDSDNMSFLISRLSMMMGSKTRQGSGGRLQQLLGEFKAELEQKLRLGA